MSLVEFAECELNRLLKTCTDSEGLKMQKVVNNDILEIVKIFSNQGHSGISGNYCLNILKRLLDYKPLSAITDAEDEWEKLDYSDDIIYQCKRCPSLFKDSDGRVYNVEGKIFSEDDGHTWFNCADSRVYVELPYEVPEKPEYIIIDNQKERQEVLEHIKDRVKCFNSEIDIDTINEDTELKDIIDESKIKSFEDLVYEDLGLVKSVSFVGCDVAIWNMISSILQSKEDSDKEQTK